MTERNTQGKIDGHNGGYTNEQTQGQTEIQNDIHREGHTDKSNENRPERQTQTKTGKQTNRHTFLTPVLLEPDPPITTDITSLFIASHIIVVRIAPENPDSWERGGGKDGDRFRKRRR